jgi:adenylosuccinate synthase
LATEAQLPSGFVELTSATGRVRRIGRFDPGVVRRALAVNAPHTLVVNHMDYVDPTWRSTGPTSRSREFIEALEDAIGRAVDLLGYDASTLLPRAALTLSRVA